MTTGSSASSRLFNSIQAVPWENGGGVTSTLAAGSIEDFLRGDVFSSDHHGAFSADWRLSIAQIDGPSAFSLLPGYDRVLVVLDDSPVELVIDGAEIIAEPFVPVSFPGEANVRSTSRGVSRDLNLFVRRTVATGRVQIGAVGGADRSPIPGEPAIYVDLRTGDCWYSANHVPTIPRAAIITLGAFHRGSPRTP